MIVIAGSIFGAFMAAGGGVFCGHVAYDAVKLYRRNLRRSKKIAAEFGNITSEIKP